MNNPYRAMIIDDEELARKRLCRLLKPYEDLVEIVGEASNGAEGLERIAKLKPDIIFLDIEMPVYNGFEMLSRLSVPPKVVFTTAYDQYAIKAFEEESVDYLLKPVEAERLEKTIKRLSQTKDQSVTLPLEILMKQLLAKKELKTLTVRIGDRILLVKLEDIAFIEAEDKYVFLHLRNGNKHLTDFTLISLEKRLTGNFIRIHRGAIINADHIREIRKGFNGNFIFIMNTPEANRITSSRSYHETLCRHFDI